MLRKIMTVKNSSELGSGKDAKGYAPYVDLMVIAAWKVINQETLQNYIKSKCVLKKMMPKNPPSVEVPIKEMNQRFPGGIWLDRTVNEKYFFHGTSKPELIEPILCTGLDKGGGLFGDGVYLADAPEKFDQYTTHEGENGHRAMERYAATNQTYLKAPGRIFYGFVVRALLGNVFEGSCDCENCEFESQWQTPTPGRCSRCGRLSQKKGGRRIAADAHYYPPRENQEWGPLKGVEPSLSKDELGIKRYSSEGGSH